MPKKTKPLKIKIKSLKINQLVIPEETKMTFYISGYNSDGVYVTEIIETLAGQTDAVTTVNSFTASPLIKVVIG